MDSLLRGFRAYLLLERNHSPNTLEAYLRDAGLLFQFCELQEPAKRPEALLPRDLQSFLTFLNELGFSASSQSRVISGVKAFYRYCLLESIVTVDPTELLESPKVGRTLPEVLSPAEVEKIVESFDLGKPEGIRNRAMLETLYSCGLRVSELLSLRLSNLFTEQGFVRVIGKGDKERLVPIGSQALKYIDMYRFGVRSQQNITKGSEDIVFLNRRGSALSRMSAFTIVREAAQRAGLQQDVHPHTFRHSFATHLVERGADLRAVQEMLGHKSITTTEIYTHLDRGYLRQTLEQFHPRYRDED